MRQRGSENVYRTAFTTIKNMTVFLILCGSCKQDFLVVVFSPYSPFPNVALSQFSYVEYIDISWVLGALFEHVNITLGFQAVEAQSTVATRPTYIYIYIIQLVDNL